MATQRGLPAVRGALDNTEPYQSTTAVVDDHGTATGGQPKAHHRVTENVAGEAQARPMAAPQKQAKSAVYEL